MIHGKIEMNLHSIQSLLKTQLPKSTTKLLNVKNLCLGLFPEGEETALKLFDVWIVKIISSSHFFIHSLTGIPEGHKVLSLRLQKIPTIYILYSSKSRLSYEDLKKKSRFTDKMRTACVPHTGKPQKSISGKR